MRHLQTLKSRLKNSMLGVSCFEPKIEFFVKTLLSGFSDDDRFGFDIAIKSTMAADARKCSKLTAHSSLGSQSLEARSKLTMKCSNCKILGIKVRQLKRFLSSLNH